MNPDSPLGVPKKSANIRLPSYIFDRGKAYRKTAPVPLLGAFLLVKARVLFGASLRLIDVDWLVLKVPAPEPPGTNWDKLGWAK